MYPTESEGGCKTSLLKCGPADFLEYCMVTDVRVSLSALILGGNLFTGAVPSHRKLAKLALQFNELTSDSTVGCTSCWGRLLGSGLFCCVLVSRAILTTMYIVDNVGHDLHHQRTTIQVCHGTDR